MTQIGLLGVGAWLAIKGDLTGRHDDRLARSSPAAPSRRSRGTIEGWRNFVQARAALRRIRSAAAELAAQLSNACACRGRTASLTVERVLYVPPPNKQVILNGVSLPASIPASSMAIVGSSSRQVDARPHAGRFRSSRPPARSVST